MTDAAFPIERLRKRADFLACARAPSCAKGSVVVQARPRGDDAPRVRAGFTATKRVGGAVVRNRAKRRMREAARLLLGQFAKPGFDYVFIARGGVTTRPWPRLLDDVKSALLRLAAERDSPGAPGPRLSSTDPVP
ncbi:ribonuclease P protein component [Phenylobacterium sp.]|uniref:ribonuclease P protein component n=1 Tax=Phenylobacterium sp. TaxID=1871053 RepID=UPI00398355B6